MQVEILAGLFDELSKVAAGKQSAGFMQSRKGTRPYRVSTLLGRDPGRAPNLSTYHHPLSKPDSVVQDPENEQPPPAAAVDGVETEKEAAEKKWKKPAEKKWKKRGEKALRGFATVRPYAVSGIKAGVPAAVLGGIMAGGAGSKVGARTAKIMGTLGAGAGMINQAIKDWAGKNPRKKLSKDILEG